MVDGGFFLAVRSGNGKGRNDPETMRQQKIQRIEESGNTMPVPLDLQSKLAYDFLTPCLILYYDIYRGS